MDVLSLFDGMACAYIAMNNAGLKVDNYYAYEIDSHAIMTAKHNFPDIQEFGDVFDADFSTHNRVDFLIGGSPCTYWSKGQLSKRRERTASGTGWELFTQYVRAVNEAQPSVFIYENNLSMSHDVMQAITDELHVQPIYINSSLVSAQDRKRLYWVGIRNPDGSYRKAEVERPENKHIHILDILDTHDNIDKISAVCDTESDEPVKVFIYPRRDGIQTNGQAYRVYSQYGKAPCLKSTRGGGGAKTGLYAIDSLKDQNNTYDVRDGIIEVYGSKYTIKLGDGTYCIRNLSVDECKRLQTVPEWYSFSYVSDTQSYKMLGNGFTCDVITHIIKSCMKETVAK